MAYTSDTRKADRTSASEDFPAVVLIDNCSACNLRCSMCDHVNIKNFRKIELMAWDLYRKIIDEIAVENPHARVWEIYYGDPFVCKDMPERIRYAKERGLTDVVLNTNGVLMTKERALPLIEAGLDAIYVGIDAATEDTYNKIRVGGDFQAVMQNVMTYRDLLERYGRPDQELYVQYVRSDVNDAETETFRNFWNEQGVKVKIRPKISWAGRVEAENLRPNEEVERKPCYWLMRTINICTDGRVALCSADLHCRVPSGNVREQSIRALWHDKLRDYRAMHREGRYHELPQMCLECRDWQSAYADFYVTASTAT
jgi:MoaA/NifB/PqqE/SkfB family radical SAM enzyme